MKRARNEREREALNDEGGKEEEKEKEEEEEEEKEEEERRRRKRAAKARAVDDDDEEDPAAATQRAAKDAEEEEALYLCPLTHAVLVDPVLAEDGRTYERAALDAWIAAHRVDGARLTVRPGEPQTTMGTTSIAVFDTSTRLRAWCARTGRPVPPAPARYGTVLAAPHKAAPTAPGNEAGAAAIGPRLAAAGASPFVLFRPIPGEEDAPSVPDADVPRDGDYWQANYGLGPYQPKPQEALVCSDVPATFRWYVAPGLALAFKQITAQHGEPTLRKTLTELTLPQLKQQCEANMLSGVMHSHGKTAMVNRVHELLQAAIRTGRASAYDCRKANVFPVTVQPNGPQRWMYLTGFLYGKCADGQGFGGFTNADLRSVATLNNLPLALVARNVSQAELAKAVTAAAIAHLPIVPTHSASAGDTGAGDPVAGSGGGSSKEAPEEDGIAEESDERAAFVCPITGELFRQPVVAEDGFVYELSALHDWLQRCYKDRRSPKTNAPMGSTMIYSAAFYAAMTSFCRAHGLQAPRLPPQFGTVATMADDVVSLPAAAAAALTVATPGRHPPMTAAQFLAMRPPLVDDDLDADRRVASSCVGKASYYPPTGIDAADGQLRRLVCTDTPDGFMWRVHPAVEAVLARLDARTVSIREVLETLSLEQLRLQIKANNFPALIGQGKAVALAMMAAHLEAAARTGRKACRRTEWNAYPVAVDAPTQRRWVYITPELYQVCERGLAALSKEFLSDVAGHNGTVATTPLRAPHGVWVRDTVAQLVENCPLVVL